MKWCIAIAAVIAVIAGFCLYAEPTWLLLTGWLTFPFRVGPQMTVDAPALAVGLGAVGLLALGIQFGGSWWFGAALKRRQLRWKWRWTCGALAGLLLLFAAGTGLVAVAHQSAWLAVDDRPMYREGVAYAGKARSNLKQIGLGVHNYHDVYGSLPPGGTYSKSGRMLHGWQTHLLPYMSYAADVDFRQPWNAPVNAPIARSVIFDYLNPAIEPFRDDDGFALTHYAANQRVIGPGRAMTFKQISDGSSHTIFAGEINTGFPPWAAPGNWRDPAAGINAGPQSFGGPRGHRGALFLMADGSVRFVNQDADLDVLRSLATPAGRR